jgi:hypothetical protein
MVFESITPLCADPCMSHRTVKALSNESNGDCLQLVFYVVRNLKTNLDVVIQSLKIVRDLHALTIDGTVAVD